MSLRHRSREIALQVLFQREFNPVLSLDETFAVFTENFETDKEIREFATFLVEGVLGKLGDIDKKIQAYSKNWKIGRMPLVDKNILRIATFELMFTGKKVPPQVVIDEAIEISKRYGSQDSSSFVNGVLDNIFKSRDL